MVLLACERAPPGGYEGRNTTSPPPTPALTEVVPAATVSLDGSAGPTTVAVEVVKSRGRIQRGLMYRRYLADSAGMLFLMGDEDVHHFWMKNTLIPLDILFIGRDMKVVGVLNDMKPHDTTPRGVGRPSLYVLEVNAGWSQRHGVGPGTTVRFDGVEAAAL